MPTLTLNSNRNLIDWRDRDRFPPDEPVTIWGSDTGGNLRSRKIAWGDIEGDFANTLDGPIQIQEVTRDADRPIHDEELVPRPPSSLRHSLIPAWPTERRSENSNRWALQLCRNQGSFSLDRVAEDLAGELGVLPQSVVALNVHDDSEECEWLLPERDGHGDIIGLGVRRMFPLRDEATGKLNTKGFRSGGKRGLYYSEHWQQDDGPVFSPEGFSDTAACLSMGLKTVGRPSASTGKEHLLFLLADYEFTEPLIIVADRDVNDKGKNVGLEGAYKAAKYLAARLQRPILVALPPDGLKDTRAWLQSFCQGDLSPARLAAAREVFLNHVQYTAETIQPGRHYELQDDDRLELSLNEWREQMQDARIASIEWPSHYADFSPTGAGKSFADRVLIQTAVDADKSVLLVVPTHANCTEEVRQLSEAGIEAVAFLELSRETCQRHGDARFAVSQGLDLVRSVCTGCRHMRDNSCVYRQQAARARQAQVAVCTTARLGMDAAVSESRDVISVHEVADSAICGQYSLERAKIEQARRVLQTISNFVHDRDAHTDDAIRRTQETREYIRGLVSLCDTLLESLRSGTRTDASTTPELSPGYWVKFVREWLQENSQSDRFHEDCEANDFEWPDDRIDGNTLRGLAMIAQGESWDVMTWPVETPERRRSEARIIVQRRLQFHDHQVWWWQDATGDLQQLQQLIGRDVEDMTPDGRLELRQSVEVIPIDISRRTAVSRIVDAIRMTIMSSGCQRLGVIGHKVHIDELTGEDSQLLIPEFRERIHMMSYYGAGPDRGSNRWLECDRLLILGTPRIGDDAVRAELWRAGEQEAAAICEPGWGDYSWQARVVGDDKPTIVGGQAYSDPTWHQACLRVTRAAMRQALGRARAILDHGVPATIWTTEELREYPVRVEPQIHTAVIDAVQVLWIANLSPESQPRRRGVVVDDDGRVILSGVEIARRLEVNRATVCKLLSVAVDQGLAEHIPLRKGWSIASVLRAE